MPPRQLLFRVQDILDSLEAIRAYIAGMEFQDFVADRPLHETSRPSMNRLNGSSNQRGTDSTRAAADRMALS